MGVCFSIFEPKLIESEIVLPEGDDPEKFILIEDRIDDNAFSHLQKKEPLSIQSKIFIKKCLMRSGLFIDEVNHRNLSLTDIDNIVNAFKIKHFSDDEVLLYQNDHICAVLYIASRGIFRDKSDSMNSKVVMEKGDLMGDLEFFHEIPSKISIVATGNNPAAFCLTKRDYKLIADKGRDLRNIKLLESLSDDQKRLFKEKVTIANFVKGDFILRKGSPISAIYLILSGTVGVLRVSSLIESLKPFLLRGDYFGESGFLSGDMTSLETFVAIRETSLCIITKEIYDNLEMFWPARAQMIRDISIRKKESYILSKAIKSTNFSSRGKRRFFASMTKDYSSDGDGEHARSFCPCSCSCICLFFSSIWNTLFPPQKEFTNLMME